MAGYSPEVRKQLQALLNGKTDRRGAHASRKEALETVGMLFHPSINSSWIVGMQQIENSGRNGLQPDFTVQFYSSFPLPFANVQVIWDENFMTAYGSKEQVHGLTARQVRDNCLVYLNGCWEQSTIVADFLIQMMSIRQVWGKEDQMEQFLQTVPTTVRQMYDRGFWKVEQYRSAYLEWMNHTSRVVYVDNRGVRR